MKAKPRRMRLNAPEVTGRMKTRKSRSDNFANKMPTI